MNKLILFLPLFGFSAANLSSIEGFGLLRGGEKVSASVDGNKKALVVVFLSAKCPCSNNHVSELKSLAKDYPDMRFVGVNSNSDESDEMSRAYFEKTDFNFPIIKDKNSILANKYSALKTPHSFVIGRDGKILYQGGVSSSRQFETADRKYLREALDDVHSERAVKTTEARTLGCTISRGDTHVW